MKTVKVVRPNAGLTSSVGFGARTLSVRAYLDAAQSCATNRAYACDLRHYRRHGGTVPSTAQQVASYIARFAATLSVATLERRLIAIHQAHAIKRTPSPVLSPLVKRTMQGIRRQHGTLQRRVRPISPDNLAVMLATANTTNPIKSVRDAALLLVGFAGAFRRSELVALKVEDISTSPAGLELVIRRSKTDQGGKGRAVVIPMANQSLCPVAALRHWLNVAEIRSGFVFRAVNKYGSISNAPLTPQSVALVVKAAAKMAGQNSDDFAGHSLRAGYVTAATELGLSAFQVRRQTGHSSDASLANYIRPSGNGALPSLL
jgi:site-specific recombinase XerD